MSDTSLVFNVLARDRASRVFAKVRRSALESSSAIKAALGPAATPVLATATAATVGLGAAFLSAGAAVGVFGAVAGTAFGEIKEAADKTDELREKVRLLNQQARMTTDMDDRAKFTKKAADATLELQARLALLPPHTRKAAEAYGQLKSDWLDFVDANKPSTFGIMTSGMQTLGMIIPKLQPLFDIGANAARRFVGAISAKVSGGGIDRFIGWLSANAGPALDNLGTIGKNFGVIVGNLFDKFDTTGQGILDWLADASTRWAEWSKQTEDGGLQKWATMVEEKGPQVKQLLSDIGSAAKNVAQATAPLAPISLAVAGGQAAILAALPPGVITTMVAAWIAYSVALKAYNAGVLLAGIGTKIWAGAQWLMNTALFASPITWIVIAIIALIAIIVLIATKTTWFQTIWNTVWGAIKAYYSWVLGVIVAGAKAWWALFSGFWRGVGSFFAGLWRAISDKAVAAWKGITGTFDRVVGFVKGLPKRIGSAASGMWNGIKNSFRSAVNWIIGKWNNLSLTIGGGSIMGMGIPSVTLNTPNIPYLAKGGTITGSGLAMVGERGPELLSLPKGAQVAPLTRGGGGGVSTLRLESDGSPLAGFVIELLRGAIRARGGNVQIVLGR